MKIRHPAVTSDVFKLVTTLEFDLSLGDNFYPTRIELFQDTSRKGYYRCRLWERELYHMNPTLQPSKGKSRREYSDEEILVERTWELSDRFEDFKAPNANKALKVFLDSLTHYLDRITGSERR